MRCLGRAVNIHFPPGYISSRRMQIRISILLIVFLLCNLIAAGQKRLDNFRQNSNFEWAIDSAGFNLTLYFEKGSYAEKHKEVVKERIQYHYQSTIDFIGIEDYDRPIHYFILENRQRMKLLAGYETNGNANPKNNFVTAIFSEKTNSVYSNHELFHLIAMNEWSYPENWINEGMAVYSDNKWHGHDLHELSKFLIDNNRFIAVNRLAKKLGRHDTMISYPLLGSFIKFIDETYGRETIRLIWIKGNKRLQKYIGKNIHDLEKEWLEMLKSVTYNDITYQ